MTIMHVQTLAGFEQVQIDRGRVLLVVGPNGVGKSAILQDLYRTQSQDYVNYYPGHRQITFSHGIENLQMSFLDMTNNLYTQTEGFNRYKSLWPEEQFKHILKRMQNAEATYNQELIEKIRTGTDYDSLIEQQASPLQILNRIFQEARMAVRFMLTDEGLKASRNGSIYQVDRLSDGERAALFMAAAVVGRRIDGIIIIDEPERHLHPSISSRLISAMVRSSPHISFIFATHDLSLIETLEVDQIIYLRDSTVVSDRPERRIYDFRVLEQLDDIKADLKRDILGARDRILFVEGESTSLDNALYSLLYPQFKISPRGGNEKVREAVKALQDNDTLHWLDARGIIDGDGRDAAERAELKKYHIETLAIPSIENLFYLKEVIETIIKLHIDLQGGSFSDILQNVIEGANDAMQSDREHIIAQRTAWFANREISKLKISTSSAKTINEIDGLNVSSIRMRLTDEFDILADDISLSKLEFIPLKATKIPATIAKLCGAKSLKSYKQTVIRQIQFQTIAGKQIEAAMRQRLPDF